MRVTKSQIVHGVTDYVHSEILPKLSGEKAMQIVLSIGVSAALANGKAVNAMLDNEIVKALLEDDGTGTYEISSVADAMRSAIDQYGSFPVKIPAIPLVSPHEITLNLNAGDVDSLRKSIENAI